MVVLGKRGMVHYMNLGNLGDVDFGLAGADGFQEDDVLAGGIEGVRIVRAAPPPAGSRRNSHQNRMPP